MATERVDILRSTKDGAKFSDPVFHLETKCFPVAPASNPDELRETYRLGTLSSLFDTVVDGDLDIRTGDILRKQDGKEYAIRVCIPSPFRNETWMRLVMDGLIK